MKTANKKSTATNIETTIELITPAKAEKMLKSISFMNPCSNTGVHEMSKNITDGNWGMNTEALVFNKENKLVNGYKILSAIMESNMAIYVCVMRNFPDEYVKYIGNGHMRPLLKRISRCYPNMTWVNCHATAVTSLIQRMWPCIMLTQDEKVIYLREHKNAFTWLNAHYHNMESGFQKSAIRAAVLVALEAGVDESLLLNLCSVLQNDLFTPVDAYQNQNFHQMKNYLRKYMWSTLTRGKSYYQHIFQVVINTIYDSMVSRSVGNLDKADSCPFKVIGLNNICVYDPAMAKKGLYQLAQEKKAAEAAAKAAAVAKVDHSIQSIKKTKKAKKA